MTRTARKPSHASADQLSFLFADAPSATPADTIVNAPSPTVSIVQDVRPLQVRAPRPKVKAKRPMQIVAPEDRRLTVEETAEILSVSVKTLEAWRRLGKGPAFVKLGRAVRYTMEALDAFTRDRTVRNSAEGRMLDARG